MSEEIKDIRVVPESECCGCAACANACPVDAIRMEEGKEGFVFPKVDLNTCIQCGKCVKTCPVLEIDRPNRKEPDLCPPARSDRKNPFRPQAPHSKCEEEPRDRPPSSDKCCPKSEV